MTGKRTLEIVQNEGNNGSDTTAQNDLERAKILLRESLALFEASAHNNLSYMLDNVTRKVCTILKLHYREIYLVNITKMVKGSTQMTKQYCNYIIRKTMSLDINGAQMILVEGAVEKELENVSLIPSMMVKIYKYLQESEEPKAKKATIEIA